MHWLESLAEFEMSFVFKKGKLHAAPDALSRVTALNAVNLSCKLALHEAVLFA